MSEEEKAIERFKKEKDRLDKMSYVAEEKKAIDFLKNDVIYWLDKGKDFVVIDIGYNEKLHCILNLIGKQQKEVEKLKQEITKYEMGYEIDKNYISKDKIREKIKELKAHVFWLDGYMTKFDEYAIYHLRDLIGE